MKQPPLIAIGLALMAIGFAVFLVLAFGKADVVDQGAPQMSSSGAQKGERAYETREPSRVWAIVGGATLACGAACVGLGMNRWRARPQGT